MAPQASTEEGTLELRALRKSFGSQTVLHDVTIRAAQGEFVSLVGPSGCGKTTTLNIVAGFEKPDTGEVLIAGRSVVEIPTYRRRLGMVFQSHALLPHMTVSENVGFGLLMRRVPKAEISRRVGKALDMVHLSDFEARYPAELSGGQQQRVGIARALTVEPRVILMDEPLSSLDAKLRREMQVELRRIQQAVGITVIYVTHDQEEALTLSDQIVLMNKGAIEQAGTPEDMYSRPASEFAAGFIGEATFLNGVVLGAAPAGVEVQMPGGGRAAVANGGRFQAGDPVRLAVRPDRVRLHRVTADPGLEAIVVARAFVGPVVRYVVDLGGAELAAQMPAGAEDLPRIGDPVHACIKPEDWLAFMGGRG